MDDKQHSMASGLLIVLPWLHPASFREQTPAKALFFDPGAEEVMAEAPRTYRPASLPLPPKQAKGILASITQFGAQFRDSHELAQFAIGAGEAGYCNAGAALRAELGELVRLAAGEIEPTGSESVGPDLLQAQQLLLLAWSMEARIQEISELQLSLERNAKQFNSSLGLNDEETEEITAQSPDIIAGAGTETLLPWPLILESMLAFLPENACFFVADSTLRDAWEEGGIQAADITSEELHLLDPGETGKGAPDKYCVYAAPAWQLLEKQKPPQDKPWLWRELRMYMPR